MRLHNALPATNGLILWEFAIATVVGAAQVEIAVQNCALSVLSVEVSFRAKSRCPKLFEIKRKGSNRVVGVVSRAGTALTQYRAKGEFPEFRYERL